MGASEESIPRPTDEEPKDAPEGTTDEVPAEESTPEVETPAGAIEEPPEEEHHAPEVTLGHFLRHFRPEPPEVHPEPAAPAVEPAVESLESAPEVIDATHDEVVVEPSVDHPTVEVPARAEEELEPDPPHPELPPPPTMEVTVVHAPPPPKVHEVTHHVAPVPAPHPPVQVLNEADAELDAILAGLKTTIKIVGLGGGGSNTIGRIVASGVSGAEVYACNTDAQHLLHVKSPHKILLGRRLTRGLGAGAIPQVGEEAARETQDALRAAIQGSDMVFVTCGLGGGTGTGGAPYLASLAKEMGALTIAICTWPFRAEGAVRWENAEYGLEKLRTYADTVVVVPNDKLIELVPRLSLNAAFKVADEVLMRSIKGITEIITKPGLVNLDFNDIRTIMKGGGVAMIGLGEADTENRAEDAVEEAISSPLIDVDVAGATGALINVTGGADMTVSEAERVAEIVQQRINPNARIIWGAAIDAALEHRIRVMLVLTGVKSKNIFGPDEPLPTRGEGLDAVR